jgi:hypothetical protein
MKQEGIKVIGHKGTWYVIDEAIRFSKPLYLLEHELYGDEAACVIIDEDGILWLENVHNGFDDLDYIIEDTEFARAMKVGVVCPEYCDQAYIRDRDMIVFAVSEEHAISQFIHQYKDNWLKPEEYKLVKVLDGEDE